MIIEPRMSENEFYKQVKKYRPNVVLITGALWHRLFSDVEQEIKSGKLPDLSFFESPIIGGEGVNAEELERMNIFGNRRVEFSIFIIAHLLSNSNTLK